MRGNINIDHLYFLSSAHNFQTELFRKILSGNAIRVSNRLNPDQARLMVGPDLDPNCLQRLSADDTSRLEAKHFFYFLFVSTRLFSYTLFALM